ncbi:hypothetical protein [Curtobacterium citreum]|uniref:hypothetical protein n=1 Tax=Curtobacterium citreum TaxID=2036 RepID=UPI0007365D62|nr:hypothetical protein [Curtobacterium citreum]KTR19673.1 hypothetical protein NS330_07460 [Curtobacterium citreum]
MPDRAAATPSEALRLLVEGNARFAADKRRTRPNHQDRHGDPTASQSHLATCRAYPTTALPP